MLYNVPITYYVCISVGYNHSGKYFDVFETPVELKCMKGEPMKIDLRDDYRAYAIHTARAIPFAQREKVKACLDEMKMKNIIEPVTEPTEWCHPMVVVNKSNGGVRICVDLTKLNEHIKRPVYPSKTPKEAVSNIKSGSKYFTTCDAKHGYWQIPLAEESQKLTTFLTPWGRFKFLRAPMGLSSTGDEYCRRGEEIIENSGNIEKVMDDAILYDESLESHLKNVRGYLDKCRENNVTLNSDKFVFAKEAVKFA